MLSTFGNENVNRFADWWAHDCWQVPRAVNESEMPPEERKSLLGSDQDHVELSPTKNSKGSEDLC